MYGVIFIGDKRRLKAKFYNSEILGMPVAVAELSRSYNQRHLTKIGVKWRKMGVKKVLCDTNIPDISVLSEYGVHRLQTKGYVRAIAVEIAKVYLRSRSVNQKDAQVMLKGDRMTKAFYQCAKELCPDVRQLAIDVKQGGGPLKEELRWEYGMAMVETRADDWSDLVLDFSESAEMSEPVVVLTEEGIAKRNIKLRYVCPVPSVVNQVELMTALWECGRLNKKYVHVSF